MSTTRAPLLLLAIAALGLAGCQAAFEPRSTMSVDHVIVALEAQPELPVTNPVDESCATIDGCSGAVRADEISVYRFDTPREAAAFADTLGDDGYQSDWIVLEYPQARLDSDSTELSYAGVVDGMWTSD